MKVYFPNLDGLRFISFFAVFLCHSFISDNPNVTNHFLYKPIRYLFSNGHLGVQFFFVLSGFLITYLLLSEYKETNTIKIKKFYFRRILRIWPLYFFNVFFGFVIFPILKRHFGEVSTENANIYLYLSFLGNINSIINGVPDSSMLALLWSVSIEEQFYLIWPLLFTIFIKKNITKLLLITTSICIGITFIYSLGVYYLIHSSIALTIGCITGCITFFKTKLYYKLLNSSTNIIKLIYFLALLLVCSFNKLGSIITNYFLIIEIIYILIVAFIIFEQCFSNNSFFKMSQFKYISNLGKYTYGLYCLHMIGILSSIKILNKFHLNSNIYGMLFIEIPLALIIAIVISKISFKYYESYFLKLKSKFDVLH